MESKPVAIAHAELPGFTELSGIIPAKAFNDLLIRIRDLIISTIQVHHGKLMHFSGDSFQAVFTAEKREENQAGQAVETMLELRERLDVFLSERKVSVRPGLKAGI